MIWPSLSCMVHQLSSSLHTVIKKVVETLREKGDGDWYDQLGLMNRHSQTHSQLNEGEWFIHSRAVALAVAGARGDEKTGDWKCWVIRRSPGKNLAIPRPSSRFFSPPSFQPQGHGLFFLLPPSRINTCQTNCDNESYPAWWWRVQNNEHDDDSIICSNRDWLKIRLIDFHDTTQTQAQYNTIQYTHFDPIKSPLKMTIIIRIQMLINYYWFTLLHPCDKSHTAWPLIIIINRVWETMSCLLNATNHHSNAGTTHGVSLSLSLSFWWLMVDFHSHSMLSLTSIHNPIWSLFGWFHSDNNEKKIGLISR